MLGQCGWGPQWWGHFLSPCFCIHQSQPLVGFYDWKVSECDVIREGETNELAFDLRVRGPTQDNWDGDDSLFQVWFLWTCMHTCKFDWAFKNKISKPCVTVCECCWVDRELGLFLFIYFYYVFKKNKCHKYDTNKIKRVSFIPLKI